MKKIAATAVLIVLSGCSSMYKRAIDTTIAPTLKDRPVAYTVRSMPGFLAMTPTKALVGGSYLGTALAYTEGAKIVEENHIENPASAIALGLATEISTRFGMKMVTQPIRVADDDISEVEVSKAARKSADFVVDVSTQGWGSGVYPLDFTHYRVVYTGNARVINTATATVIAEGYCGYKPDDINNAPEYDELFGNGAERFKKEMALLISTCVRKMQADMRQNNSQ